MAVLSSKERGALSDSDFAYVEPGHKVDGKTPDKYRHFPIHDAAHVRNALARIAQGARFGSQAKAKVLAAAKKFGVDHDESSETGRSLESLYPEMRFIRDVPELRAASDSEVSHITGYASVFGKPSRKLGGFVEVVENRAFDNALAGLSDNNVVCRYNHRDDMVLGTTRAGTLTLEVDERGLRYDVMPPSTRADVLELVERGDVQFSSFAFRCMVPGEDDSWGVTEWNAPLRTLHNVELIDVAPVLDPAYFDTSAAARNMTGAVESLARWVEADVDEVRSYLSAGQAIKFFKRSDRPSKAPEFKTESRVMDDRAVAIRNWKYDPDAPTEAELEAAEENEREFTPEEKEETRAALRGQDALCRRWVHGEPCVRDAGHDGDCSGPCWGHADGLPCCKPEGHVERGEGQHEAMSIRTRGNDEPEGTETRTDEKPEGEEQRGGEAGNAVEAQVNTVEAQAAMDKLRAELAKMQMGA